MEEIRIVCPFCGEATYLQRYAAAPKGAVAEIAVLSVECPCGATYALTRGGRPHARSD